MSILQDDERIKIINSTIQYNSNIHLFIKRPNINTRENKNK